MLLCNRFLRQDHTRVFVPMPYGKLREVSSINLIEFLLKQTLILSNSFTTSVHLPVTCTKLDRISEPPWRSLAANAGFSKPENSRIRIKSRGIIPKYSCRSQCCLSVQIYRSMLTVVRLRSSPQYSNLRTMIVKAESFHSSRSTELGDNPNPQYRILQMEVP